MNIIVLDGSISSVGTLAAAYSKETGPKASYKGTASLNHFASVVKADAEDFLKWNSLYVDSMDVTYNPLIVKINEVALSDYYSRIIINADGSINLQKIIVKAEQEKVEAKVEAEAQGTEAKEQTKIEVKAEKEQEQVKAEVKHKNKGEAGKDAKNQAKNGNKYASAFYGPFREAAESTPVRRQALIPDGPCKQEGGTEEDCP